MRLSRQRTWALALAASTISLTAFALFIWPTPYRYETVTKKGGDRSFDQVYRINRWDGSAKLVVDTTPQPSPPSSRPTPRATTTCWARARAQKTP